MVNLSPDKKAVLQGVYDGVGGRRRILFFGRVLRSTIGPRVEEGSNFAWRVFRWRDVRRRL